MTRGRKPLPAPAAPVEINEEVVRADIVAADTLGEMQRQADANVRAVAVQLGYQLPADCTDPDLIQRDIAINMRRSVEACLEVGRGLRVLKEACGHGNFVARLDVLGIDKYVAARFMQSAAKFSKLPSTATLTKAIGNQTKLFEMLVLDDEQLEELELTGQTGELKLDEIATMSVKELRAALREAKAEATAKDRVIEAKARREAELEKSLARVQVQPPDEALAELRAHLGGYAVEVEAVLSGRLMPACQALQAHHAAHGGDSREVLEGALRQVERMTASVRAELGLMGGLAWDALKAGA